MTDQKGSRVPSGVTEDYDPCNLEHVCARWVRHRQEAHAGDFTTAFDCASCGALDARLARLERAQQEARTATKQ